MKSENKNEFALSRLPSCARFGSLADIKTSAGHVRLCPKADIQELWLTTNCAANDSCRKAAHSWFAMHAFGTGCTPLPTD